MAARASKKNADVDAWLRAPRRWPKECARLRSILLDCGLDETFKWGKPCYAHDGHNVAIVQEMKSFVALMFFKGALLRDAFGLLESQGENTRSALRVCFTDVDQVARSERALRDYVRQAIEVEKAGLSVPERSELVLVAELQHRLSRDPALQAAFAALTPGRQRAYNIYVSGAKRSETRAARVESAVPRIMAGEGFRD